MPPKGQDLKRVGTPTGSYTSPSNENKIQLALEVLRLPQQHDTAAIRKQASLVLAEALQ